MCCLYLIVLIHLKFSFQFRLTKGKFACIMIFAEALTEIGIREAMEHCPGGMQNIDDHIIKDSKLCLFFSMVVYPGVLFFLLHVCV